MQSLHRVEKSHSPMVCSIATGDLSTQRFNSPEVFIPIPPCPSARDDGGGRQHTVISKGQMAEAPHRPRHFDRSRSAANRKASYCAGKRPTSADLETLCRVSTEWRNLTPCWYREHWAGDLSTLRFHSPRGFTTHTGMFPRSR